MSGVVRHEESHGACDIFRLSELPTAALFQSLERGLLRTCLGHEVLKKGHRAPNRSADTRWTHRANANRQASVATFLGGCTDQHPDGSLARRVGWRSGGRADTR